MKSTKVLFTNFWGDEVTKRQYVDEKIRVLSEMLIFSPKSVLKREERSEYLRELKRTIRKILKVLKKNLKTKKKRSNFQ